MLYQIFVYEYPSGTFLFKVTFREVIENGDLFAGFVTALKSFSSSVIRKDLTLMQFEDMWLKMVRVPEQGVDVVIVFDREKSVAIAEVVSTIRAFLSDHAKIFERKHAISEIEALEKPLKDAIESLKRFRWGGSFRPWSRSLLPSRKVLASSSTTDI